MLAAYQKFWRQFFDFKNRSSRSVYWWVFLANLIIYLVLTLTFLLSSGISVALSADVDHFSALTWIALILLLIWGLASIIPMSALAMRRIRDTGLSPFLWLLFPVSIILGEFTQVLPMIISAVLAIVYLVFTLLPSKPDKIKSNSQIKGSLIVTTGLLVLIIFSVGHLPAKAEQIVYGNPTQPVLNGEVNQNFVQRFNGAVILKNDEFIIDQSKVPKNATTAELKEFNTLTKNSTSIIQDSIKEAETEGDNVNINTKAVVITEEFSDTEPDAQNLNMDSIKQQAFYAGHVVVQTLAAKKVSKDKVDYRYEWWGTVGTSYSIAGSRKIGNELISSAKLARNAALGAGVVSFATTFAGPWGVPAKIILAGGAVILKSAATQRENALGVLNKFVLNGTAKNGLRVQIDNSMLPNGYKVTRR